MSMSSWLSSWKELKKYEKHPICMALQCIAGWCGGRQFHGIVQFVQKTFMDGIAMHFTIFHCRLVWEEAAPWTLQSLQLSCAETLNRWKISKFKKSMILKSDFYSGFLLHQDVWKVKITCFSADNWRDLRCWLVRREETSSPAGRREIMNKDQDKNIQSKSL